MNVYEKFQNPSKEYTTVPFWFWNAKMDKEEIARQLELMYAQKVYECVIHARHGLETPYLSDEWFDCIDLAISEGKRLGMRFWIYDENNWPSGYPDGEYRIAIEKSDLWTPAGMVSARKNSEPLTVSGSVYDEYYIGR